MSWKELIKPNFWLVVVAMLVVNAGVWALFLTGDISSIELAIATTSATIGFLAGVGKDLLAGSPPPPEMTESGALAMQKEINRHVEKILDK